MTCPDMSIKVERKLHDMRILGWIVRVRSTERSVGIKINKNKNVDDLNVKFIKYLPDDIMKLLDEAIKEIAA